MDSETIIQTTKHPFPSLYSLDPETATIADAEKCLKAGCDADEIDDNGEWSAASYFAVHSNNAPLIRYLLRTGKPKKLSSYKKHAPLLSVVKNHGVAEALLDYGLDIDEADDKGRTALMLLSKETENQEFVLHLIRRGADVGKEDANGWNALDYAVKYEKTPQGQHNYMYNFGCGKEYVVGALFENGAKARRPQTLEALSQSVSSQVKIALLQEWTDFTPDEILEALEKNPANKEILIYNDCWNGFLWHGFLRDPKKRNNPFADLDYRLATAEDVKNALDAGDVRTDILDSPMIVNALKYGNSRLIVRFLKKALKDINHRNSDWETPLMIAASAKRKNTAVIQKLLEAGADPTLKNNDGETVYEMEMFPENKEYLEAFFKIRSTTGKNCAIF